MDQLPFPAQRPPFVHVPPHSTTPSHYSSAYAQSFCAADSPKKQKRLVLQKKSHSLPPRAIRTSDLQHWAARGMDPEVRVDLVSALIGPPPLSTVATVIFFAAALRLQLLALLWRRKRPG